MLLVQNLVAPRSILFKPPILVLRVWRASPPSSAPAHRQCLAPLIQDAAAEAAGGVNQAA